MSSILSYYYLIEINTSLPEITKTFPQYFDEWDGIEEAIYSSLQFSDYNICVEELSLHMQKILHDVEPMFKAVNFAWSKNDNIAEGKFEEHDGWFENEMIKFMLSSPTELWILRARVFFKNSVNVLPEHKTIQ